MVETTGSTCTVAVNPGAGGAVVGMMLVWRVATSRCSVWSRQMRPSAEVQSSARDRKIEKSASEVDWRVMGETENVSQQEYSTGHGARLAERAPVMLHAAMKVGNCREVGVDRPP